MLDSLITNADAMQYVKINYVLDLLVGIIVIGAIVRVFGFVIWDWTEPARKSISMWWKKRKEHEDTMKAIDKLN